MISAAICGASPIASTPFLSLRTLEMEGMPISLGHVATPEPSYDLNIPTNRHSVLIHVRAFSCNYRDKAHILRASQLCERQENYLFLGSEFVGDILAIGPEVTTIHVGDRVIGNNYFPALSGFDSLDAVPGIPSEESSQRFLLLHEAKVIKIPPQMPDDVAAAFSLNAQTAYAMLRRLNITPGAHVLVMSARSNASLFTLQALRNISCHVYAMTTSPHFEGDLQQWGIQQIIHDDPATTSFLQHEPMADLFSQINGFDYVIDPFFDLHLSKVLEIMSIGGKYITCGLYDQYSAFTGKPMPYAAKSFQEIMTAAFVRNIQIIGHCLGQTTDLQHAIDAYIQGKFHVVLDTVCRGEQLVTFLQRTYTASDRFGKVVYCYDS